MIRITRTGGNGVPACLTVEGSVSGDAVATVDTAAREAAASAGGLALDLSRVTFADSQGVAILRNLEIDGVQLVNLTPFVAALLDGERR